MVFKFSICLKTDLLSFLEAFLLYELHIWVVSAQFSLSAVSDSVAQRTAARQASLSITNSRSLLKLVSVDSVIPSNHLILCRPLLLLHSMFPSSRVCSNESVICIRWTKYQRFSFSICPCSEYRGLISLRIDRFDLLENFFPSLLQLHSSKSSVLQCSSFFMIQLSHPHMTTEKTIVLTRCTFVGKVMPLIFNMLSRLVTAFL